MRIGIYAGTFDPVHSGHVALGLHALEKCALDRVVFIPEEISRGKERVTALEHRLRMLELATAGQPALSVIALRSKQFTIRDTLPELHSVFPGAQLVLIIGSDVVKTFDTRWPDLEILFRDTELIIALRGEDTQEDVELLLDRLPDVLHSIIQAPQPEVASSAIRAATSQAKPALVHDAVASYITEHTLYM